MPSPFGHALAGVAVAWTSEIIARRTQETSAPSASHSLLIRAAGAVTPLAVVCGVLAVSPDFDVFLRSHRTYSHSVGASLIVWAIVAAGAWIAQHSRSRPEGRNPRVRVAFRLATICAAAYASHVLLDWLGRDAGLHPGPMALWPFSDAHYKSGLDLFFEIVPPYRAGILEALFVNAHAILRELLILGPLVAVVFLVRVKPAAALPAEMSRRDEAA